jgi:glycosyltransferase involved in cell wall biosynthesis
MNNSRQRILLIPDQINGMDSGGQSARATLNYLQDLGHHVAVYSQDATSAVKHPDVHAETPLYQISLQMRWHSHIHSPDLVDHFRGVLQDFSPNYVFFVGGIQKPAVLGREARKQNIRTVYLFYINDYFCPLVYAGRENGPCTDCIKSPLYAPLRNGCFSVLETPYLLKSQTVRHLLAREILNAYKVVGYGQDQLDIARKFGVQETNLALIGFQFSPHELIGLPVRDGGYFALTGQTIIQKGWHLLSTVFARLNSDAKFKISFRNEEHANQAIERFDLRKFVEDGRIECITDLDDRCRYLDFLASARAVLLPSYYPTTGEFGLQEPMALGKPVHVFNVGVHMDLLVDRQNAMVSAIGDIADYAQKIDEVEQDLPLRTNLGINAKLSSNDFYSPKQVELLNDVFVSY